MTRSDTTPSATRTIDPATTPWPADEPRHLTLTATTMVDGLARSAARAPGRIALHYYGATLSYGALHAAVERLGRCARSLPRIMLTWPAATRACPGRR